MIYVFRSSLCCSSFFFAVNASIASCSTDCAENIFFNTDGDLDDLCMWSTSLTAPIQRDKSPAIASKSLPAAKAFLIPLYAAVAVEIAALTVNGSMAHL